MYDLIPAQLLQFATLLHELLAPDLDLLIMTTNTSYGDAEKGNATVVAFDDDKKSPLTPTTSVGQGQIAEVHSEDGQFHRSFTPHQVHVCSETLLPPAN